MTQPTRSRTPLFRLIEAKLGESLEEFVAARRQPSKSWREIAEELEQLTGESVTDTSVRTWFAERDRANAA